EVYGPGLSWARVAAVLALLLFWLPVIGLVAGVVAYGLNRCSPTWTYRASLFGFVLAGLVHAALAVMIGLTVLDGQLRTAWPPDAPRGHRPTCLVPAGLDSDPNLSTRPSSTSARPTK